MQVPPMVFYFPLPIGLVLAFDGCGLLGREGVETRNINSGGSKPPLVRREKIRM